MASTPLNKLAYQTLQQGKNLAGLAHKELSTKLMGWLSPDAVPKTLPVPSDMLGSCGWTCRASGSGLARGEQVIPSSCCLIRPGSSGSAVIRRCGWIFPPPGIVAANATCAICPGHRYALYPDYYLQNFHHQTDGYLSDHSAGLYDLQVEILFNGTADAMRRRVLAPLRRGLKHFADHPRLHEDP